MKLASPETHYIEAKNEPAMVAKVTRTIQPTSPRKEQRPVTMTRNNHLSFDHISDVSTSFLMKSWDVDRKISPSTSTESRFEIITAAESGNIEIVSFFRKCSACASQVMRKASRNKKTSKFTKNLYSCQKTVRALQCFETFWLSKKMNLPKRGFKMLAKTNCHTMPKNLWGIFGLLETSSLKINEIPVQWFMVGLPRCIDKLTKILARSW